MRFSLRYTPFDVGLSGVSGSHVANLRDVAEGLFVEYKSEVPKPHVLAKSLASFANRSGGWLFLGVRENSSDNKAESFPGIESGQVTGALEQIRNAAKDLIQPTVQYSHRTISGPVPDISLPSGRSLVIVEVPEGAPTPYVHNDGRIYIRTGDSSSPVAANNTAALDQLLRKAEEKKSLLNDFVYRSPVVSKGEDETTFLHLAICSNPFRVLGHGYSGSYMDFRETMHKPALPFDNIYSSQEGFVARQSKSAGMERTRRQFTWEFSRTCNSFVTLPLTSLEVPDPDLVNSIRDFSEWARFEHGMQFASRLSADGFGYSRVLDLSILVVMICNIVARHRSLAASAGIYGPFHLKARIENAWRVIPFLDAGEFIAHTEAFGVPVVQESDLSAPLGDWPEGFVTVSERTDHNGEWEFTVDPGAIEVWIAVLEALGIPGDFVRNNIGKIVEASTREAEKQRNRLDKQ